MQIQIIKKSRQIMETTYYIEFIRWLHEFSLTMNLWIFQETEFVYLFFCTVSVKNNIHFVEKNHRFIKLPDKFDIGLQIQQNFSVIWRFFWNFGFEFAVMWHLVEIKRHFCLEFSWGVKQLQEFLIIPKMQLLLPLTCTVVLRGAKQKRQSHVGVFTTWLQETQFCSKI